MLSGARRRFPEPLPTDDAGVLYAGSTDRGIGAIYLFCLPALQCCFNTFQEVANQPFALWP